MAALLLAIPGPAAGHSPDPPAEPSEDGSGGAVLGAPAALDPLALEEARVRVPAGAPLHTLPDPRSGVLVRIDAAVELPELERRGDWVRVRYGSTAGWILLGRAAAETPSDAASGTPLAVPGPDPGLLERVRRVLGNPPVRTLGPYDLYTDVEDERLLAALDRLVRSVGGVYRQLYGLDPGEETSEAVVLVDDADRFRELVGEGTALDLLGAQGHAGFGVAVVQRRERGIGQVGALLVHELVHLLDRRTLGPVTPPWVEEGLAHALAFGAIRPDGTFDPEELGGQVVVRTAERGADGEVRITVERTGARAALQRQAEAAAAGRLMPLETLTALSWRELADPAVREDLYARAAFLVRYLLDDPARARAFRGYLATVAAGGPADGGALLGALETDWQRLEEGLEAWLRRLHLTEERRLGG